MRINILRVSQMVATLVILIVGQSWGAELVNVTGSGVELTYVSIDCAGENEGGLTIAGASFVGKHISVLNCIAAGIIVNETATLTNSLAISDGADVTIAADKTLTGTYNLFGDAAKAGAGTYSDGGSTSLWSAAYADRRDSGVVIEGLHDGTTIIGGDALGNTQLFKCDWSLLGLVDIGAVELACYGSKSIMQSGMGLSLH